eukprot:scaffold25470_cov793-Cylindrotheca_fusiformis.AAC.2
MEIPHAGGTKRVKSSRNKGKLPEYLRKTLLKAVEKRNLERSKVALGDILSANEDAFGEKSSPLRCAVQEYWYNVKRSSIRSYCRLLSSLNVPKSQTTLRLLQEDAEGRLPSPDISVVSEDDDADDGFFLSSLFENKLDITSNTMTPITPQPVDPPSAVLPRPTVLSFSSPSTLSPPAQGTHH